MSAEAPQRYTIAVDFDGVLHSYVSGWVAADALPDPPVPGAIEWLNEVAAEYDILILTTRARYPEAIPAIEAWLREHGFTGECVVTCEKGPALLYLDDRAWRFRGKFPTLRTIRYAKPWRVGDPAKPGARAVIRQRGQEQKKLQDRQRRLKFELRAERDRSGLIHEALHDALDLADEETCEFCPEKPAAAGAATVHAPDPSLGASA
ncbi:MAG: hypothetical protein M3540_03950 [Actinomycetota bacterium]|nr:hypothetical protein [Actinomycetota bacterium]